MLLNIFTGRPGPGGVTRARVGFFAKRTYHYWRFVYLVAVGSLFKKLVYRERMLFALNCCFSGWLGVFLFDWIHVVHGSSSTLI